MCCSQIPSENISKLSNPDYKLIGLRKPTRFNCLLSCVGYSVYSLSVLLRVSFSLLLHLPLLVQCTGEF